MLVLAGLLVVGSSAMVIATTTSASAATLICDQYGSTPVGGKYIVQNNRWGTTATQCISATDDGFSIVQQDGTGNLGGAPVSYPSIYLGCHYSNCSPGSPLPAQIRPHHQRTQQHQRYLPQLGYVRRVLRHLAQRRHERERRTGYRDQ